MSNFKDIYKHSINNSENFWQDVSNDVFWFLKPKDITRYILPKIFGIVDRLIVNIFKTSH